MLTLAVGPTRIAPSVLQAAAQQPAAIWDRGFMDTFAECLRGVRTLHGAQGGSAFVVPATGTMGLEMLVTSLVPPDGRVVVLSTGAWGDRWAAIAERGGRTVHRIVTPAAGPVPLEELRALLRRERVDAVLATYVDSSSGIRLDLEAVAGAIDDEETLLLVDGICGAAVEECRQHAWSIGGFLSSTPKAIGAPAGLVLVSLDDATTARMRARAWSSSNYSLDLLAWLPSMAAAERGEFRYWQSPAGNLVTALAEALRLIRREGLAERVERHRRLARQLRAGLETLGCELLVADESLRANGVTVCRYPVDLPVDQRGAPFLAAVAERGVVLPAGTHPDCADSTFRIGHLGGVTEADVRTCLDCLEEALHRSAA